MRTEECNQSRKMQKMRNHHADVHHPMNCSIPHVKRFQRYFVDEGLLRQISPRLLLIGKKKLFRYPD